MWLEGADAVCAVDEYSDIDIWVDFEDAYEEEAYQAVESALSEISAIDYKYVVKHSHPKIRQRIYHLKGSSEYLMIDFCWQLHSRPSGESEFVKSDMIERVKVLFDKANVLRFVEPDPSKYEGWSAERLEECKYRYSQLSRVRKYVLRGHYLEAYAYYNRYVLEPLVDMLRLIYTPAHADHYLIHISQHIPKEEINKLEYFAQIASLDDISERISLAEKWFNELLGKL